jgi:hypothetical protein
MRILNSNIDGTTALVTATLVTALGFVTVASGLLTTFGTRRRLNSPLYQRGSCLGLDLRDCLGCVLRKRSRHNWCLKGRHLYHRLTSTMGMPFSHIRHKETVNPNSINTILNIFDQTILMNEVFGLGVQP